MGGPEVEAFLTHLAVEGQVAASTQNQALAALLFLYQQVLEMELPRLDAVRARRPERLPVVLSRDEVRAVLDRMAGSYRLMAGLMYGSGLRLLECCRLRVKDVDFERHLITVREGKGDHDRAVPLPRTLMPGLRRQVEHVQELHRADLSAGLGRVWLPAALAAKYPRAESPGHGEKVGATRLRRRPPREPAARRVAVELAGRSGGMDRRRWNQVCIRRGNGAVLVRHLRAGLDRTEFETIAVRAEVSRPRFPSLGA
jgi:integrase